MRARWMSAAGVMVAGSLALAGCGPMPDDEVGSGNPVVSTADEGVTGVVVGLASPDADEGAATAGEATPEIEAIEAEGVEVSIKNGKLDPFSIEAQPGNPVIITVSSDGKQHTLEIKELVDPTTIAATGPTDVDLVAAEEPGTFEILIDGKRGGEFRSMAADGAS
ncbi:MAG: hypothetical protein ACKOWF_09695, partial [Chloroflexota bacterium]